jgi:hypothetical protein
VGGNRTGSEAPVVKPDQKDSVIVSLLAALAGLVPCALSRACLPGAAKLSRSRASPDL